MFDFLGIKKTLADVGSMARKLRQQIETLQRQREDIASAPCAREDIKQMVDVWVGKKAADYSNRLSFKLQQIIPNLEMLNVGVFDNDRFALHGSTAPQPGDLGMQFGPDLVDSALCAFFEQALVTSLHRMIDAMEWPSGALPMRGRDKKISDLDVQIEKLIQEEAALVREAQEAGIQIS
jgi:hypothetical protein